jgi:hypothetical protein
VNAHVVVDRAFFVRVFFNMRARLAEAAAVEINLRRGSNSCLFSGYHVIRCDDSCEEFLFVSVGAIKMGGWSEALGLVS